MSDKKIFIRPISGNKTTIFWPNQLVTDFLVNGNFYNNYFRQQFTTIGNNNSTLANTTFKTEERFSTFEICQYDIVKIIRLLDPNKAHGHDEIFIHTIKHVLFQIQNHWRFSLGIVSSVNVSLKNRKKLT